MQYRIILKPCADPERCERIAAEIAAWAGKPVEKVRALLLKDGVIPASVCVKRGAEMDVAQAFMLRMMPIGAPIELEPEAAVDISNQLTSESPAAVPSPQIPAASKPLPPASPVIPAPRPAVVPPADSLPPAHADADADTDEYSRRDAEKAIAEAAPAVAEPSAKTARAQKEALKAEKLAAEKRAKSEKLEKAAAEKQAQIDKRESDKKAKIDARKPSSGPVVFGSPAPIAVKKPASPDAAASPEGEGKALARPMVFGSLSQSADEAKKRMNVSPFPAQSADEPRKAADTVRVHCDDDDDDDDEEYVGRIRSDAELASVIRVQGSEYYGIEVDRRMRNIMTASFFAAILIGIWLGHAKLIEVKKSDFFERLPKETSGRFITGFETPDQMKKKQELAEKERERKATLAKEAAPAAVEEKVVPKEEKPSAEETKTAEPASEDTRRERRQATTQERKAAREEVGSKVRSMGLFAAIAGSATGTGSSSAAAYLAGPGEGSPLSGITGGAAGFADISSLAAGGGFARKAEAGTDVSTRRGEAAGGVAVERTAAGRVEERKLEAAGAVSVTSAAPPQITGESAGEASRSMAAVNTVITQQQIRLKKVFEEALKREPGLGGKIVIRFSIQADGSVSDVSVVTSTTGSTSFDNRIITYVKRWLFPAVSGGGSVEVTCPFVFSGAS